MSKQTEVSMPAEAAQPSVTLSFDQLQQLIAESVKAATATASPAFDVEQFALAAAKANQAIGKKENEQHPHVSAFSHPEGDIKQPRPTMRCDTFWYGDKINGDRHSYLEMELLNQIEPGEYLCSRPDGTQLPVKVEATLHPITRAYTKIEVTFTPEDGRSVLSMVAWLNEILEQQRARTLVTA